MYRFIYFLIFAAFLDTHAQMPVLSPWAASLGASPFMVGLIIGSYSLFNITGNLWAGLIIDRKGFQKPLALSLLGITLIIFFYSLLSTPGQIFILRSLHGILGGLLIPSTLCALNSTGQSNRSFSMFGICIGLAALAGPLLTGGLAGLFNYQVAYLGLGLALLPGTILSLKTQKLPPVCNSSPFLSPREKFKILAGNPFLIASFYFALGLMGGTGTMMLFLPLHLESLGFSPAITGLFFSLFALGAILTLIFWPILSSGKSREIILIYCGLFIAFFSLLLFPFLPVFPLILTVITYGVGFGLVFPGLIKIISSSPDYQKGITTGVFFAFYSAGVAGIPPLAALVWDYWNLLPTFTAFFLGMAAFSKGYLTLKNAKTSDPQTAVKASSGTAPRQHSYQQKDQHQ